MDELMSVLQSVSVLNRDNGRYFTNTERLDAIASLLRGSQYRRINADGLAHIYSRVPLERINMPVLIISSHVDCESHITKCFTSFKDEYTLHGTFDNSITNASIVFLMRSGLLPDNVLVAFTGDEEENGNGARDVIRFIDKNDLDVLNIFVLDVTEEGWAKQADFTVENDFWDEDFGRKVVEIAEKTCYQWYFVPEDPKDIWDYIPKKRIIAKESDEDESWDYDEANIPCFSFCLPTIGKMHSNKGIFARVKSFERYTEVLGKLLTELNCFY